MRGLALLPLLAVTGCMAFDQGPMALKGTFGGPHIGVEMEGGLGTVRFDCAAGTIDPKLTQFANKKLQRALDNLRKAAQATKAKQQQKLIDKAGGLLGKILRRELGTTSDGCLQLLTAQVDEVLDTLPRR